jgi:hypothetical protein
VEIGRAIRTTSDARRRIKSCVVRIDIRSASYLNGATTTLLPKDNNDANPRIVQFSPGAVYGAATTGSNEHSMNLSGSIGANLGSAEATITPSISNKETYDTLDRSSLLCDIQPSEDGHGHELVLQAKENARTKQGIPNKIRVGLVVCHSKEPFVASLEYDPDDGIFHRIFAWGGDGRKPRVFTASMERNEDDGMVIGREFYESQDQWKSLVQNHLESVNVSDHRETDEYRDLKRL